MWLSFHGGNSSEAAADGCTLSPSLRAWPADAALPAHSLLSLCGFSGQALPREEAAGLGLTCVHIRKSRAASGAGGRIGTCSSNWAFLFTCPLSWVPAVTSDTSGLATRQPRHLCLPPCGDRCFLKGCVGVGNEMGALPLKKTRVRSPLRWVVRDLIFFFFFSTWESVRS